MKREWYLGWASKYSTQSSLQGVMHLEDLVLTFIIKAHRITLPPTRRAFTSPFPEYPGPIALSLPTHSFSFAHCPYSVHVRSSCSQPLDSFFFRPLSTVGVCVFGVVFFFLFEPRQSTFLRCFTRNELVEYSQEVGL